MVAGDVTKDGDLTVAQRLARRLASFGSTTMRTISRTTLALAAGGVAIAAYMLVSAAMANNPAPRTFVASSARAPAASNGAVRSDAHASSRAVAPSDASGRHGGDDSLAEPLAQRQLGLVASLQAQAPTQAYIAALHAMADDSQTGQNSQTGAPSAHEGNDEDNGFNSQTGQNSQTGAPSAHERDDEDKDDDSQTGQNSQTGAPSAHGDDEDDEDHSQSSQTGSSGAAGAGGPVHSGGHDCAIGKHEQDEDEPGHVCTTGSEGGASHSSGGQAPGMANSAQGSSGTATGGGSKSQNAGTSPPHDHDGPGGTTGAHDHEDD